MSIREIEKRSQEVAQSYVSTLKNLWENGESKEEKQVKEFLALMFFIAFLELHKAAEGKGVPRESDAALLLNCLAKDFKDIGALIKYSKSTVEYKGDALKAEVNRVIKSFKWKGAVNLGRLHSQDLLFIHEYTPYNFYLEYVTN